MKAGDKCFKKKLSPTQTPGIDEGIKGLSLKVMTKKNESQHTKETSVPQEGGRASLQRHLKMTEYRQTLVKHWRGGEADISRHTTKTDLTQFS